jgi:MerR family transcriptional regulator/heat shock protein HspR
MDELLDDLEGFFSISVVSQMLKLHPQTIRHYERQGLIQPKRSSGNIRLFSMRDVRRLRQIHEYTSNGVNLAGVLVIVELLERIEALQHEAQQQGGGRGESRRRA